MVIYISHISISLIPPKCAKTREPEDEHCVLWAKAYLCNQGGTMSPFLSWLACWILSLTDKNSITLIPAYIPTHFNVEANYLSEGWLTPKYNLLPQMAQAAFYLWGLLQVGLLASSYTIQCQHYYTLEIPLPLGALGLNAFNHPWTF